MLLVGIDRPSYGSSDPHPNRSALMRSITTAALEDPFLAILDLSTLSEPYT